MTGLSKELITGIKRSSPHSSDAPSGHHPAPQRFKECMREHRSTENSEEDLKDQDQEKRWDDPVAVCAPVSFSLPMSCNAPASAVSGAALLPCTEIEALFEKMASTMLVMHTEGGQETTFLLDSPQFASSSLFGTRITIKEFSTAPKVFNIEIASHQTGLHLLAAHKDVLLAAFESHRLPFSVHRLDIELHGVDGKDILSYHNANEDEQQEQKEDERS